jgi:hypothetical protein
MPTDRYFDPVFFLDAKLQEICGKHEVYARSIMSRARVEERSSVLKLRA